ncbi:POPLD domain-containing protein [Diplocarpon rosae]|nr:POPLD domain-containing protein [Diplocarpon rosae]
MPPKNPAAVSNSALRNKKRKDPPDSSAGSQNPRGQGRNFKRVKYDARSILTQSPDGALKNGELDLHAFLKSREFEIRALQNGMQKSKQSGTTRAFQQVPRDMRRRTASHNVKRVPKRLQKKAAKEMRDDNTPTVAANKRKPGSSRGRIRAETAKRLGVLAARKRAAKAKKGGEVGIEARAPRPKIRKDALNEPPKPKSKFRKRQIHKTWLPTHLWHAKRATMTAPKNPMWRFAIPLTPTAKSYRPTHRASGVRGAVAWDMSYMSTIGLEGPELSLEKLLKAVGVKGPGVWEAQGTKWRQGKRTWRGWLTREDGGEPTIVGPSTILWCPVQSATRSDDDVTTEPRKPAPRRVFMRVHPSTFLEIWTQLLRLSKLQRPAVHIEDLRFEIGSIDITGPSSTEALLAILHPYDESEHHARTFQSLKGVTNPGSLPPNSILAFSIMDPRLRYPPRPVKLPPNNEEASFALLELLSTWPVDASIGSGALFEREARFRATRLPSQKALNRRKSLAPPGDYPAGLETDPKIPITLIASRPSAAGSAQGTWTLLAPWKCILPIWYGLMHCPLSSGGNPRFGGQREIRQIHFEHGVPYFPHDFPGTSAGFQWEAEQRLQRHAEWNKRPKGKRVEWESLKLGAGRKGELGRGWACDFEHVLGVVPLPASDPRPDSPACLPLDPPLHHLASQDFRSLLSSPACEPPPPNTIATIRLTLVTRGVASPCARIYRLPPTSTSTSTSTSALPSSESSAPPRSAPPTTRAEWLALLPPASSKLPQNPTAKAQRMGRIPLDTPLPQRVQLLAQSLLQAPPPRQVGAGGEHPLVPEEEDLIGFVTTGEFNLAEGKGVAVGSVLVARVLTGLARDGKKEGRLCIVRNAGEEIGRLARWEAV